MWCLKVDKIAVLGAVNSSGLSSQAKYFLIWKVIDRTLRESRKAALRTYHWLLRCQSVFTKRCHYYSFLKSVTFDFSSFVTIWVFEFVTIRVFKLCHNLRFWVLSQFEFLSFDTVWVFEFSHNLIFWVLYQFDFFFKFFHNLSFGVVTIWVFEFCRDLSFRVLSQFRFLTFVKIWVF